jgi:hypothetical protein
MQKAAVAATWFGVAGSVVLDGVSVGSLSIPAVAGVLACTAGVVTGMISLEECLKTNNRLDEARALQAQREELQREIQRFHQIVGH